MPPPGVSVIVLTRDRPAELERALAALDYQRFRDFEVIVVGPPGCLDPAGLVRFRDRVRLVTCAEANVSHARNLGIAAAAGGIVAFQDDDAAAEPAWLGELLAGFLAPDVGGVGGFVLGRTGVRWQWTATGFDAAGEDVALPVPPGADPLIPEHPGLGLTTIGTNCAFRRAALLAVGGFDSRYRYFLDETEIDRRLLAAGWRIALAPRAVVHHAFSASASRRADRVPRDLFEIGASKALFVQALPEMARAPALAAFRAGRRRRLLRAWRDGLLTAGGLRALLAGLDAGFSAGPLRPAEVAAFPAVTGTGTGAFPRQGPLSGLRLVVATRAGGPAIAARAAAAGAEVSLIDIVPAFRRLRVRFDARGWWLHEIGRFAPGGAGLTRLGAAAPVRAELARIAEFRQPMALIRQADGPALAPSAVVSRFSVPGTNQVVEILTPSAHDIAAILYHHGADQGRVTGEAEEAHAASLHREGLMPVPRDGKQADHEAQGDQGGIPRGRHGDEIPARHQVDSEGDPDPR